MPDLAGEPLLDLSPERQAIERRRSAEAEAAVEASDRARRRVLWQCVALSFAGVPIYAWSWHVAEPGISIALGFFVSYAIPFFRWLAYHVSHSDSFGR
jgi:hypothetical protein